VRSVHAAVTAFPSNSASSSTSTSTGVAPTDSTASAVAMKVMAGTMTSSPGPTPVAPSTISSAWVPLLHPTPCAVPQCAANASSSLATLGPLTKAV